MQMKIGFIGGGNMAQALIGGLLAKGYAPEGIWVSEPNTHLHASLNQRRVVLARDNQQLIEQVDVVVLAVKPQVMPEVLQALNTQHIDVLYVSIAAGVTTQKLSHCLNSNRVVRAMPNTPALVECGATGLYAGHHLSDTDKSLAAKIMAATGMVVWVQEEAQIDAVTAVSGSGPAYFFYMMEAMIAAGVQAGLSPETAKSLTLQTALGAAQMAITSSQDPHLLRANVTSPHGTTYAAIQTLTQHGVGESIKQAVLAAAARSQALAQE